MHNALQTLWGSGDPERDIARKNTAKSMISPATDGVDRPQEIYTPQLVLNVIARIWPEGIACDPCSGPLSLVIAPFKFDGITINGLTTPWFDFTYANPPYKTLEDWLRKAVIEGFLLGKEVIVLCPVRTHRVWFRAAMLLATRICWMDPLTFIGYEQSFPAPLCLMYFGKRTQAFETATKVLSK